MPGKLAYFEGELRQRFLLLRNSDQNCEMRRDVSGVLSVSAFTQLLPSLRFAYWIVIAACEDPSTGIGCMEGSRARALTKDNLDCPLRLARNVSFTSVP